MANFDAGLELLVRYPVEIRSATGTDEEMTRKVVELMPMAPALRKSFPPFGRRLIVRGQSARDFGRRTGNNDCDFALEIGTGKIVIVLFRHCQAISYEHQRSLHLRSEIDARAEEGIFAKGERLSFPVADESEA